MKLLPLHRLVYWLLLLPFSVTGQCLTPELALINSCIEHPNPNGSGIPVESELLALTSGLVPTPVSEIGFDLPFNGFGDVNFDVGVDLSGSPLGCPFKEPTITSLPGCDLVIPLGPDDVVPPQSIVVFFTTGTTVSEDFTEMDFSNICPLGEPVYVLQSACERTSGAFANGSPASGDPLRTITIVSPCGLRSFSYNTQQLDPAEGTYYLVGLNEIGNLDCDLPVLPETCPAIDTTLHICDPDSSLTPYTALELASIYPEDVLAVSFHTTAVAAELNDERVLVYQPTGAAVDTLYARIVNSLNFCIVVGTLRVEYRAGVAVSTSPHDPLRGCDPDTTGTGVFNLRLADQEIGGGQPVTYYTDAAGTQPIADPENYGGASGTVYAQAGIFSCRGDLVPVDLLTDPGPQVTALATETTCPLNDDGTVVLSATGTGELRYRWSVDTFAAIAQQTGLAAGQYAWTVTDAAGCPVAESTTVATGANVALTCTTPSGVTTPGASDGAIAVTIKQGRGPFTVDYSGGAAGAVEVVGATGLLPGLPVGNYLMVVTDSDGCTSAACQTTITELDPVGLDCAVRNNANANLVLGALTATLSGGVEPFSVLLTDANGGTITQAGQSVGDVSFSGLPAGTYTITVIDAAGQTVNCSREILDENCPLEVVEVRLLVADCTGSDNTVISLGIAGFRPPIVTRWSGPNNITLFNGMNEAGPLPPGTYFAEVSDAGAATGCPAVQVGPVEVVDRGELTADLLVIAAPSACAADGEAAVVVNGGGTPPYTVILSAADGTEINRRTVAPGDTARFTALTGTDDSAPNYAYRVVDDFGCATLSTDFELGNAPRPTIELVAADQQLTPPTCFGEQDGAISLTASGATAPYTYDWLDYPALSGGRLLEPGPNQTDLPAGDYVIAVTEAGGCSDTLTVSPAPGNRPTLVCGTTTPTTGTTPGTVRLSPGADNPPLLLTLLLPGGQRQDFSGFPPGDTVLTMPVTGDFAAFATDDQGCRSDTCTFNIAVLPCALAVTADVGPVDCSGEGLLVVSPSGGTAPLVYNWSDASFPAADTVRPTVAGDYGLKITDANGCVLDTSFTVTDVDNLPGLLTDTLRVTPNCAGDSIFLPLRFAGTGPFSVELGVSNNVDSQRLTRYDDLTATDTVGLAAEWFPGAGGRIRLHRLADANCTVPLVLATDYVLTRPDTIRRTDLSCRPEGVTIGGRLFTPDMPSDTFFVDDGSACGQVFEVDLTFLAPQTPDTLDVFICPGTRFEIPETGDVFNAGRPAGEVAYPRAGDCDSLVYVRLEIPEVKLGSFGAAACEGDTIFLGDSFFTVDRPSGIASLPGEGADGCDSLVTVNVNFTRVGELRLLGDHVICRGDSLELRFSYAGQGSLDARLENLQGDFLELSDVRDGDRHLLTPEQSTTWSIVFTERSGCPGEFSGRSQITVSDLALTTEVLTDPADFCNDTLGRSIVFPAGGAGDYAITWSNGPTDSLNPDLPAGTYGVTVTDGMNCVLEDSVIVTERSELTVGLHPEAPVCEGRSGRLFLDTLYGGVPPYQMSLDGDFFLPAERIGDFRPPVGSGQAVFRDADDCRVTLPFVVPPAREPRLNPRTDTTIFAGDSVLLDPMPRVALDTFWWSPPPGLTDPNALLTYARPSGTTEYTLHLWTTDGCAFTYAVTVEVDERLPVYAPTAFSPNGDGVNDVYRLETGQRATAVRSFQVFNRWGTLVHDGPDGWDGFIDGRPGQSAVYVFRAVVKLRDGSERSVEGGFVLRR